MENKKKNRDKNNTIASIFILTIAIIISIAFISFFEMRLNSGELSEVHFLYLFFMQKFIEVVLLSVCVGFVYDFLNEKTKKEEENKREKNMQKRYTFTLTVFKRVDLLNDLAKTYSKMGIENDSQKDIEAGVRFKQLSRKLERIPLNINENSKLEMKEISEEMESIISSLDYKNLDYEKEIDELIKEKDDLSEEYNDRVKELDDLVKERDDLVKERDDFIKEYDEYSKE